MYCFQTPQIIATRNTIMTKSENSVPTIVTKLQFERVEQFITGKYSCYGKTGRRFDSFFNIYVPSK